MADREEPATGISDASYEQAARAAEEIEHSGRHLGPGWARVVAGICVAWTLYQLWIASPLPFTLGIGILIDLPKRGIHLAFALLLVFLTYPATGEGRDRTHPSRADLALAVIACACALYVALGYDGLVSRQGVLLDVAVGGLSIPVEAIIGGAGIVLLLESTRRSIGMPLVIVCGVFLVYSVFGQSMPDIISHKGVSLERLIGYQWLTGEAVFGIPIDVSVSFVFLFVLFGALLEKAGAGKYFLDLAFAMVGRYRGGPAKAAILASAMTGAISGSSIANVVTTGTFTIPVMKRMGMPAAKAGAIEVAASTNGQLMPPIMGAAAFIIAEFIGIAYFDVVVAAAIPAVISYLALLWVSHLEALKLGLTGLPRAGLPHLWGTFLSGLHFLIPIVVLIYLLMVERWTPGSAVYWSILSLMAIIVVQHVGVRLQRRPEATGLAAGIGRALRLGLRDGVLDVGHGMIAGARNMVSIGVAVAAAGIIVGAVSSTGLNNAMVGVVEAIAGSNIYILLGLTALLCLLLGMGLPTTANYLVVASLLAGVLVELGRAAGLELPLIAVHLFVFYFGLLADSTPPVCLAAYAAAAISRADPLKTGVQSFLYDIRTAILPFVFLFNPELLLIGVRSFWHGAVIFAVSLVAILAFSSAVQGWLVLRTRWYEVALLLLVSLALFRPAAIMDRFYPPFADAPIESLAANRLEVPPGGRFRLHVTRETEYGDRYKLFVLRVPDASDEDEEPLGLTLADAGDGRFVVEDLAFDGLAEQAGLEFGDLIDRLDIEQPDRPAKEWVWPLALLVLLGVALAQWRRRGTADALPSAQRPRGRQ